MVPTFLLMVDTCVFEADAAVIDGGEGFVQELCYLVARHDAEPYQSHHAQVGTHRAITAQRQPTLRLKIPVYLLYEIRIET